MLRILAGIAATFAWFALVLVGGIKSIQTADESSYVGWLCVAAGAVIAYSTAHIWAVHLPGVLLYSSLGALIALLSGHAGPDPTNAVSRADAALLLLTLVGSAGLIITFAGRPLGSLDRLALTGCVFGLAYALVTEDVRGIDEARVGVYVMLASPAVGWGINRWRRISPDRRLE